MLDHFDKDLLKQEQQSAKQKLESHGNYRQEYAKHVTSFRLASEKAAKKKKKGKPWARGTLPTSMSQEQARECVPPGSHIWRGLVNGSWQGHLPPFARVYEAWNKTSEQEAMRRVIKALCEQYMAIDALPRSECPFTDSLD